WAKQEKAIRYVYLHNVQASPERMARYLLKAIVSSIFSGRAQLFTLLHEVVPAEGQKPPGEIVRGLGAHPADLDIYAALVAFQEALGDPEAPEVLSEAAQMWLSGDEISDEHAARLSQLGGRKIGTQLPDDAAVERALLVIAGLLGRSGRTLVVCLD